MSSSTPIASHMQPSPPPTAHRNVEAQLVREHKRKREPGDNIYPLRYSPDLIDFDNWDHMVLMSQSLTIHDFRTLPSKVLDLGCGGGHWVIEAAKRWPNTQFIGFDIKEMQPKLDEIIMLADKGNYSPALTSYTEFARRIKWVNGNMLDRLPFRSNNFDFVRISCIGLAVPEDEWQFVFEEVFRVMKPGGILEIFEEEFIFPCGELPAQMTEEPEPAPPLPPPSAYPHIPPLSFEKEGHQQQKLSLSTTASSSGAASLLSPSPTISSSIVSPSTPFSSRAWTLPSHFSNSNSSSKSLRTSAVSEDPYPIASSTYPSQTFHQQYNSETTVPSFINSQASSFDNPGYANSYSYVPSIYPAASYSFSYNQTTTTIANKSTTSINGGTGGDSHSTRASTIEERNANHRGWRDHSRIRASWEAMLASRFLPPQLLPVLPFHLSSTFEAVQSYPLLQINLPPNSGTPAAVAAAAGDNGQYRCPVMSACSSSSSTSSIQNTISELEGAAAVGRASSTVPDLASVYRLSTSTNGTSESLKTPTAAALTIAQQFLIRRAPMHLAKTVRTIIACKEAIWDEYFKLYVNQGPPVKMNPGEKIENSRMRSVRDEFERNWMNWEDDMTDRIGSRARIRAELSWNEPLGEKPSWKVWRDGADLSNVDEPSGKHICRSMRAFVARKPAPSPPPPPAAAEHTGKAATAAAATSLSVSVASLAAARVL